VLLPLILLAGATVAGGALAYGTHPDLAYWRHGIALIMLARRVQWLLVLASILPCLAMLGLVVAGRRRAWWLIGLMPVLALFIRTYAPGYRGNWAVNDAPVFVDAPSLAPTAGVGPDDWVVGVVYQDQAYALPFDQLFVHPALVIGEQTGQRLLIVWSATGNRALAAVLARTAHARDLEIVATPADSLLLFDHRLGGFICGLTGAQVGTVPAARAPQLVEIVPTGKAKYGDWIRQHPDSRVLLGFDGLAAATPLEAPRQPVLPLLRFRQADGTVPSAATRVDYIQTPTPCVCAVDMNLSTPLNTRGGKESLLLLRDARTGACRVFDRHLKEDLYLSFTARHQRKMPEVFMADSDTGSLWTAAGHCVEGTLKGSHLHEVGVDSDVYLQVMRFWDPQLQFVGGD
jgi:hypothetical protein